MATPYELSDYHDDFYDNPSASAYQPDSTSPSRNENSRTPWMQMVLSFVTAPRFRRYIVVYLTLVMLGWAGWRLVVYPRLRSQAPKAETDRYSGANSMDGLTLMRTLDPALVPESGVKNRRRLIVVGDVHGCKDEVVELLDKVSFDRDNDHLIFTGDLINKGPESLGVVDLARQLSASCVRGNHEDRVLLLRHQMTAGTIASDDEAVSTKELSERSLARALTDEQVKWLDSCPIILNIGIIPDMGQVVVVHGGLVPGVELEKQDPFSVMNMRSLDEMHVPSSSKKGMNWAQVFNENQSIIYSSLESSGDPDPRSQTMTVIYGHDSTSSLSIRTYTKGLDTGCVKGGKLTALVIEEGGKQSLVQVHCQNYSKQKKKRNTSFLSFLGS